MDWKGLRMQTPWVKKPPSEYFRENMFVGSQPIEITPDREAFMSMLKWLSAEKTLLFCSDYPHWDFDSPTHAFPKMDNELRQRIFYENARELYRLPDVAADSKGA